MLVISNTSPLLYLHQTDRLEVLKRLYGRISLAPAVLSELRAGAELGISVPEPGHVDWLSVLPVPNTYLDTADLRTSVRARPRRSLWD